jgi:hypothetical protein
MTVAAAWRERGVGRLLLQALTAWATEHPQIEKVGLRALASNERAVRLYTRVGFLEEGRCPKTIKLGPGRSVDKVVMDHFVEAISRSALSSARVLDMVAVTTLGAVYAAPSFHAVHRVTHLSVLRVFRNLQVG